MYSPRGACHSRGSEASQWRVITSRSVHRREEGQSNVTAALRFAPRTSHRVSPRPAGAPPRQTDHQQHPSVFPARQSPSGGLPQVRSRRAQQPGGRGLDRCCSATTLPQPGRKDAPRAARRAGPGASVGDRHDPARAGIPGTPDPRAAARSARCRGRHGYGRRSRPAHTS